MERRQIKEKIQEIKKKMMLIEWDKKMSNSFAKDHIYEELKEEYEKLTRKLENEGQKEV